MASNAMSTLPGNPSSDPDEELFGVPKHDILDLGDAQTVAVWTRSLEISEDDLRRAVDAVGPAIGPLYDHIKRSRRGSGAER